MKPSIGRIVTTKGHQSNGTDEQPAVITRVWTDGGVNLTVIPDSGVPQTYGSVTLFENREAALAWLATTTVPPLVAFWPDRV